MAIQRSLLGAWLGLKCPRCRKGRLFTYRNPYNIAHVQDMPDHCPVCGQPFSLEPGFYFGATYVSYAINIGLFMGFFVVSFFVLHIPYTIWTSMGLVAAALLLTPILFRLSRAIWISFFVKYDPEAHKHPTS